MLGFVYFFAFLSAATQIVPLVGDNGLLPADNYLEAVESSLGTAWNGFLRLPSIFWINHSDAWLLFFAWLGVILSVIVLFGFANVPILTLLWFMYMSYNHIGQLFYGYGWEIQLLETGFLAIFLVPLLDPRPFPSRPPPAPVIWLLRWLAFRINIGSGLIKIRGDTCWRELTCLFYHYETQPIPLPLSPWFHFLPKWFHKVGVWFTHFIQLVVPWFVFWPRIARHIAGSLLIGLQVIFILSGNLSFLNWLTILPAIGCFDDSLLRKILPKRLVKKAEHAEKHCKPYKYQQAVAWSLIVLVAFLSIPVITNLFFSERQAMNTSFTRLHLVNTYGAFGSVGKVRNELVLEGTTDSIITEETEWKAYEFRAKPTDVSRPHVIIAPYQPRVDWQIWFAAFSTPQREPWLIHMVWKLLHNDPGTISLIANNPFPDQPPKYIRIEFYRYTFVEPWKNEGVYWEREYLGTWIEPLSIDTPGLKDFIQSNRWQTY